jgi:mono/diheme cytochrome c family protein
MKTSTAGLCVAVLLLGASAWLPGEGRQSGNATVQPSRTTSAESVYAEIGKAPEKARAKRNPLKNDPDAAAAGGILFEQHCAECHGETAEGGKKGPSLRAEEVQTAEPGAIFWILTNGVVRKGMPVWSKLPEPQRWQLVSFIKSLGMAPAKVEAVPPARIENPPQREPQ